MIADELLRRCLTFVIEKGVYGRGRTQLINDLREYIREYVDELPPIEESVEAPKVVDDIEEQRAYVDRTLDWLLGEMPRRSAEELRRRNFIIQLRYNCETNNYHVRLLYRIIEAFNEGVDRSYAALYIGIDEAGDWDLRMVLNERVPIGRSLTLNYLR